MSAANRKQHTFVAAMAISPDRYIRELHCVCALLTLSASIVCAAYSTGRGIIQLTYTVNNTSVATAPHHFDIAFVFSGMLIYSTLYHLASAYSSETVFESVRNNRYTNRIFCNLIVVVPSITVATVVGISAVTDVFAVYASAAIGLLLATVMWTASQQAMSVVTRSLFVLGTVMFYCSFWVFVWVNATRNATPIVLMSTSIVLFAAVCSVTFSVCKRPLVRMSICTDAVVGLQLSCAAMWVVLHHSANASTTAGTALITVLTIYGALCVYTILRLTGASRYVSSANDREYGQQLLSDAALPAIDEDIDVHVNASDSDSDEDAAAQNTSENGNLVAL